MLSLSVTSVKSVFGFIAGSCCYASSFCGACQRCSTCLVFGELIFLDHICMEPVGKAEHLYNCSKGLSFSHKGDFNVKVLRSFDITYLGFSASCLAAASSD